MGDINYKKCSKTIFVYFAGVAKMRDQFSKHNRFPVYREENGLAELNGSEMN